MPPARVFISSVMRDFEAEREAARAAVESLRLQPVMAEDFGARSLALPFYPQLEADDQERVAEALRAAL